MTPFPPVKDIIGDTDDPMTAYRRFDEWSRSIGFKREGRRITFALPSKDALPRLEYEIK